MNHLRALSKNESIFLIRYKALFEEIKVDHSDRYQCFTEDYNVLSIPIVHLVM